MFSTLDDRDVDRLLAGMPSADRELAPLAELAAFLRRSAAAEKVPPMGELLLTQLRGAPVVAIAARKAGRSVVKAGAAAAAVVAVVGLGVGASQNRLPSGLQDVLSSTADLVGIHIPTTDERPGHAPVSDGNETGQSGTNGRDGEPGHEGTTPGGATPADPGTPGDHDPATPATPPEQSNGTPGDNSGKVPDDDGTPGQSNVTAPSAPGPAVAPATPAESADDEATSTEPEAATRGNPSTNGAANGQGSVQSAGQGSEQAQGAGPPNKVTAAGHGPPAETSPGDRAADDAPVETVELS